MLHRPPQSGAQAPSRPVQDADPRAPFVLLDDNLSPGGRACLFQDPVDVLRCDRPDELDDALARLDDAAARGLHAAGYLAYEAGYLLEPKLAPLLPPTLGGPLLWFGLFERPRRLDAPAVAAWLRARAGPPTAARRLRLSVSRAAYLAALDRVKTYIAAGDVYQINLTFKYLFDYAGDPLALYAALRERQQVAHGAFLRLPEHDVLSLSPELFLQVADGAALAKPMKGTAARGATPEADRAQSDWLHRDEKSRAENLMIVDLLRNDLGRVAEIGSVRVPELFAVESYPTVHQMVSSVTARLRPGTTPRRLIEALFPCGSITGAPKVRAMEIIRELEPDPRGVYTGAIGMIAPDGDLTFNVAIRTAVIDRAGHGEMGVGSGIVYDSDPDAEFDECLLKARFLTGDEEFRLLETLRWTPAEGFYLLDRHLARLAASAAHFGFPIDLNSVRQALDKAVDDSADPCLRVRLLVDSRGAPSATATAIAPPDPAGEMTFVIAATAVDPEDEFFYHKTTRRAFYEAELARYQAKAGCDEVVFVNDRGELTEGSRTNIFIERGGRLITPPVRCGLLPGTLRAALIDDPQRPTEERVLTVADLAAADRIFLGNSVRGLVPARRLG
jgi:para-aminobenzoate synthetase/4-amino-4-deoxychorismate lyase